MAQFMWGKANILIPDRGRAEAKSSQEVAQCLGERERLGAFRVPIFPSKKREAGDMIFSMIDHPKKNIYIVIIIVMIIVIIIVMIK